MTDERIDVSDDEWRVIEGFPNYAVSYEGVVINLRTARRLTQNIQTQGNPRVMLTKSDGVTQTGRYVKRLVAEAWVDGKSEIFNTPIQLDGDKENCHAGNIMWRPRWFAISFAQQFYVDQSKLEWYKEPKEVENILTGQVHESVLDASIAEGALAHDVGHSARYYEATKGSEIYPVFPIASKGYRFVE